MVPASQLLGTGTTLRKRAHRPPSARRSPVTFSLGAPSGWRPPVAFSFFRRALYTTFSSSFLNPECMEERPFVVRKAQPRRRQALWCDVRSRRLGSVALPDTSTTRVSASSVFLHSHRGSTAVYTRRRGGGSGGVAAACMMGGACAGSNLRALFRMAELRPRFQFLVGRTDGYELRKRDEGNPAGSRGFGVASQTGYMSAGCGAGICDWRDAELRPRGRQRRLRRQCTTRD
uniref:Uncharacterized protein n=1 Tax=Zea mays TaxID=4577 RepID=B6UCF5_MAIZE|nr:hypothetical protein [Zea mays]